MSSILFDSSSSNPISTKILFKSSLFSGKVSIILEICSDFTFKFFSDSIFFLISFASSGFNLTNFFIKPTKSESPASLSLIYSRDSTASNGLSWYVPTF